MSDVFVLVLIWTSAMGAAVLCVYLAVECWREYRRLMREHRHPVMGRPNLRRLR